MQHLKFSCSLHHITSFFVTAHADILDQGNFPLHRDQQVVVKCCSGGGVCCYLEIWGAFSAIVSNPFASINIGIL